MVACMPKTAHFTSFKNYHIRLWCKRDLKSLVFTVIKVLVSAKMANTGRRFCIFSSIC